MIRQTGHGHTLPRAGQPGLPPPAGDCLAERMSTPHTTGPALPAQHHEVTAADVGTVVNRHGIRTMEPLIRPYVRHTPAITVDRADFGLPPGPLVLKLEQLQHAGSFKARGAFANLLLRDRPAAGVVAASGG